tara:strand:- start:108 stop:683 length:576 start_codon:yes stop_codon:yes gene_type:complete
MAFKIAILISGNGSNMLNIIKAKNKGIIKSKIVAVVSDNPKSQGINKAIQRGIKTKIIDYKSFGEKRLFENKLSDFLENKKVNLICLAGFMRILSKEFVDKWRKKIINIHPSLLPAFKGLQTHKKAIETKVKYSGCTIHFVNDGLDSGEIIDQEIVKIDENENEISLKKKILMKEHKLYIRVLINMEKNDD